MLQDQNSRAIPTAESPAHGRQSSKMAAPAAAWRTQSPGGLRQSAVLEHSDGPCTFVRPAHGFPPSLNITGFKGLGFFFFTTGMQRHLISKEKTLQARSPHQKDSFGGRSAVGRVLAWRAQSPGSFPSASALDARLGGGTKPVPSSSGSAIPPPLTT